jgi:UDP-GlcNAc:undecaprenyl-phosphate/decaprenyl-phosphate GlcNAc-1-phosphate transferase
LAPYLIVAAVGASVAVVATPVVRVAVSRLGGYDVPTSDRKVHTQPTPTYGGVSIYVAFAAAFVSAMLIPALRDAFQPGEATGILLGGAVVLALGIIDDKRELSWPPKLAGQFVAAAILYFSGVELAFFWLPGIGEIALSAQVSAVLSILWIVLLANAVNYIDGLDGLAAGLTVIAAAGLFLYARGLPEEFLGPDPLAPLVLAALVGACAGFLPFNFHPASIFMGDTGAMPLGFFLAAATISLIGRFAGPAGAGGRLGLPLIFTPIIFLAIPLVNVALVTLRRLWARRPLFEDDAGHIHDRLLRFGHSHRQAVLLMYGWALLLTAGLVVAGTMAWGRFLLAFAMAAGTVLLLTFTPALRRSNWGARGDRARNSERTRS